MAMTAKVQNRLDEIVAALKETRNLSLGDRDDDIEIITQTAAGTNGLSLEEKVQALSENLFNLSYLFIRAQLEGAAAAGFWPALFRLLERCRWQVTIIALGAFVLFGYRPEIIENLKALRALLAP